MSIIKTKKKIKTCLPVSILIIAILFLSNSICIASQELLIRGTGDSEKLLKILGEDFEKSTNGAIHLVVPPSIGSTGGIRALIAGKTDLARTARPLRENESPGLIEIQFAHSPIVFATSKATSEVTNINSADIIGIFREKIHNWKDLGGADHKIYPLEREADDSSRKILLKALPGFPKTSQAKVYFSVTDSLRAISKHKYTIGFFSLPAVQHEEVNILNVNGLTSSDPAYPFINCLCIVSKGEPSGIAAQFIEYLFSPAAKIIMEDFGVIQIDRQN